MITENCKQNSTTAEQNKMIHTCEQREAQDTEKEQTVQDCMQQITGHDIKAVNFDLYYSDW